MSALAIPAIKIASIPAAMKSLDRLDTDIKNAPTLEILNALADAAAGFQRRWKPVKDIADRAGECWVAADVKRGQELAKVPKAKHAGPGKGKRGAKAALGLGGPTRAELGIGKKEAARSEKIAGLPPDERKALIEELKAEGKAITPNAVLARKRAANKAAKKQKLAAAAFSNEGPFDCAVIDPPWPMQKIDREVRPNQDSFAYRVMSEAELIQFWPRYIAARLSQDCHVFCWTTQKFLPLALRLIEEWSLKYVLTMVWRKSGGFQPVGLPQYNCEFVIYARKGAPVFIDTKNFDCCFEAPRREHSRKPDEFYDIVRRVTGGSRIDIFSRERRDGFAQYGDEPEKFARAG